MERFRYHNLPPFDKYPQPQLGRGFMAAAQGCQGRGFPSSSWASFWKGAPGMTFERSGLWDLSNRYDFTYIYIRVMVMF